MSQETQRPSGLFGTTELGMVGLVIARFSTFFSSPTTTLSDEKPIYLVEGNIGAGKSTLCKQFARTHNVVCESVGDKFVQAFNGNRARFAFALQMTQLTKRQYALELALARDAVTILDRSLVGDFAFALWNTVSSNMADDEWALYCEQAGTVPKLPASSRLIIVFLHDDVESCAFRQRRRDLYEIDTDYLAGLEAAHLVCLACLPASIAVVELCWQEYAREHTGIDFLSDAISDAETVLRRRATFRDRARLAAAALTNQAGARLVNFLDTQCAS